VKNKLIKLTNLHGKLNVSFCFPFKVKWVVNVEVSSMMW
jgi:hypothetical protein